MDYNSYECTPLFSYDLSRTAIRHMKADANQRERHGFLSSQEPNKTNKGSKLTFGQRILVAVISCL